MGIIIRRGKRVWVCPRSRARWGRRGGSLSSFLAGLESEPCALPAFGTRFFFFHIPHCSREQRLVKADTVSYGANRFEMCSHCNNFRKREKLAPTAQPKLKPQFSHRLPIFKCPPEARTARPCKKDKGIYSRWSTETTHLRATNTISWCQVANWKIRRASAIRRQAKRAN
jgi:hypothetical protein